MSMEKKEKKTARTIDGSALEVEQEKKKEKKLLSCQEFTDLFVGGIILLSGSTSEGNRKETSFLRPLCGDLESVLRAMKKPSLAAISEKKIPRNICHSRKSVNQIRKFF